MLAATIILCFTFFALIFFYSKTIKRQILDFIALKKLPAPPDNNPIVGNILYLHTSRGKNFKIGATHQTRFCRQRFQEIERMGAPVLSYLQHQGTPH
jgi:hypothetical protein